MKTQKYISNIDIKLSTGKIVPMGTVFYKNVDNTFSPWFNKELKLQIDSKYFVIEKN